MQHRLIPANYYIFLLLLSSFTIICVIVNRLPKIIKIKIQKMHYQTGNMREIHNDLSPYKSAALDDRDNDIDYRSRY